MRTHFETHLLGAAISAALICSTTAHATNGMLLEGYGPIATGMGGCYRHRQWCGGDDQHPAALALMADGSNRFDISIGVLGPNITSSTMSPGQPSADSDGTAYPDACLRLCERSAP
ncbi:MAG: hypothetical protein R3E89_13605 [Thiolinea sp.]